MSVYDQKTLMLDHGQPFGEAAWLFKISGGDSIGVALMCQTVSAGLRALTLFDVVTPGLDSIAVQFDPAVLDADRARSYVQNEFDTASRALHLKKTKVITIPVCTEGSYAPDLAVVAQRTGLAAREVIDALVRRPLTVLNMGFAPGFAYLGPISQTLKLPRRATPRMQVPQGSLGLAAGFAGLYSLNSPGGWHIIGRTPLSLFNPAQSMPFALQPGMLIEFTTISREKFEHLNEAPAQADGLADG